MQETLKEVLCSPICQVLQIAFGDFGWSGALDQSTKRPQLFPVTLTTLHVVFPPRLLGQEITIEFI